MYDQVDYNLSQWLVRIRQPHNVLNNHSICPFAKALPKVIKTEKLNEEIFDLCTSALTIVCETSINSTPNDLELLCDNLHNKHNEYYFLPDHPDKKTYIQGIETGNGHYPLIIVQTKTELDSARNKLNKTNYYSYWDQDYLKEILAYGYMDRMGQTD